MISLPKEMRHCLALAWGDALACCAVGLVLCALLLLLLYPCFFLFVWRPCRLRAARRRYKQHTGREGLSSSTRLRLHLPRG